MSTITDFLSTPEVVLMHRRDASKDVEPLSTRRWGGGTGFTSSSDGTVTQVLFQHQPMPRVEPRDLAYQTRLFPYCVLLDELLGPS